MPVYWLKSNEDDLGSKTNSIQLFIFRLARRPGLRQVVGWLFSKMFAFLPVTRLRETASLVAFQHPQPVYPVHILLVPKRAVGGFEALTAGDQDFLIELVACVQSLVREMGLEEQGYRLLVNGGGYQDFPHLHFHLVSGEPVH